MENETMEVEFSGSTHPRGEQITCVMEALLMPAGSTPVLQNGSYGKAAGDDGSIGRGVIYLYLNSGQATGQLKGYKTAQARRLEMDFGASKLTATETCVLERLSEGKSNKIIASDMFVSVNTIKTHVRSIFQKLNVNCRSAAVRKALDMGLAGCSD